MKSNSILIYKYFQARLAEDNVLIQEETKALIKQLEAEQGNLSQYTEQQERATKLKIKSRGIKFWIERTNIWGKGFRFFFDKS